MAKVEIKPASKLTVKEALAELKVLAESVEFDEEFGEKTPLKELQKLVQEGREALAEAEGEPLGGADDEVTDEDEVDIEESDTPKGKGVNVYGKNGEFIRTYTEKLHGKEFRALAKQFVEKVGREGYTLKEAK